VLGKWNEEKASSKEAVSKWNDQEIGVLDGAAETDIHLDSSFTLLVRR
jgi:hypothetical protein